MIGLGEVTEPPQALEAAALLPKFARLSDIPRVARTTCRTLDGNDVPVWIWQAASIPTSGDVVLFVVSRSDSAHDAAVRRAAQAETTHILENISDGFYAVDANWRFTYVNPRASALFGRAPSELIGRSFFSVFPNLHTSAIYDEYSRAISDHMPAIFESFSPVLRRWITFRVTPRGARGLDIFFRDVSARRDVEDALAESEMRLRLFIDGTPAAIAMFDTAMRYLAVSRRFLLDFRLQAHTPASLTGRSHYDVFPETPEHWRAIHTRVLAGETLFGEDDPLPRPDGGVDRVRWEMVPWRHADGSVGGALLFLENITDRKRAEAALRDSETRLRLVQQIGRVAYFDHVLSAPTALVCAEFTRLFGLSTGRTRLAPADFLALVHPDDRERVRAEISGLGDGHATLAPEFRIHRPDGSMRWIAMRTEVFADAQGRPSRVVGAQQDITEIVAARNALLARQEELEARVAARTAELSEALDRLHQEMRDRERAESQLRQSQKMEAVGLLSGGIAHDFNNMLQAIGGGLELVQRRMETGRLAQATALVEGISRTVERAGALTHRLLAFARRQALQPCPVMPNRLIHGMAELIRSTVGPAIVLERRLAEDAGVVLCDPNQLENALLNVVINARDAMPAGGRIVIATHTLRLTAAELASEEGAPPGDYVEIAVTDTGLGMDEATRSHAFEPFFTTKPLGQGTGLGLSQVYGFVRQSGGIVGIESAPGRGTTVRLRLPRHDRVDDANLPHADCGEPERSDAGEVVLLVEDEAAVRSVMAEQLRDLGYRVLEAETGPEALDLIRPETRVDVLVSDVGLPGGLNGRQVADAIRYRRPDLPVLFITGYAGSALSDGLGPGMEVLAKPFGLDTIAAKVRAMLR